MNSKIKLFLGILILVTTNSLYAQNRITPLKIGDKIPDVVLTRLLKHPNPINLSTLHQQDLLIINFWATWCVPCIRELPKLDSLAAAYSGKLKVLSVAYEKKQTVSSFLNKHPEIPTAHLFMATDDKILVEYFKHRVIPHNIWIDKNGIIKNITGEEEINAKNVEVFFKNGLSAHDKIDRIDFDFSKTFHLKDSDFIYRSLLTGFTEGINGGFTSQTVWNHPTERWLTRFFAFNVSRQQLLWMILNKLNSPKDYYNTLNIETADSTRFFWPEQMPWSFKNSKYRSRLDWEKENAYCYELTLPQAVKDSAFFVLMLNDLQRVFQIDVSVKKKLMPACILTSNNNHQFSTPLNDSSFIDMNADRLIVHNVSITHLYDFLNENLKPDLNAKPFDPPFIDHSGINHPIDLQIDFLHKNPAYTEIKEMIKVKYGINYEIKEHEYPVTVVKDLAKPVLNP
jgi:thiol-disulfide isomerase/thioredoxin